ncbi:MAG TPA: LuxR C-terminal-related transcriptional regulator [Candidatus Nanopelagicaceae bacterium]
MTERVLLINDDAFELATLAAAMRLHGVNIIGEASSYAVATNLFKKLGPDVVVIDVQFNAHGGVPFAQELRKLSGGVGLVLTTACPDLRLLGLSDKEIPMGTQIVLKRSVGDLGVICDAIPDSVQSVKRNEKMMWMNHHSSLHENAFISILHHLTDIQIETLRLVATGMSNAEIGRTRFVSEKSVEQIVARVAQHLGIIADRKHNLRVIMAGEYFKWIGAPRH